jgi:hypothetical protein
MALRAGGIRAPAALCFERRDGNPRADASTVWGGVRLLEMRARHPGGWRLRAPERGRACVIGVSGR